MALTPRDTHSNQHYQDINLSGNSRAHLGDIHNHGQTQDEQALNAILESLSYPGMTDRRDALAEAHGGTFDWTFEEGNTQFFAQRYVFPNQHDSVHSIEMKFTSWLRGDIGGLYCVFGKPGAGKSSYMKSLASNRHVEELLLSRHDDHRLVRADHFFWILGGPIQKSVEGLLRALVHSILRASSRFATVKCYEAAKTVCGSRWASMDNRSPWGRAELKRFLRCLTSMQGVRWLFIVDALDECESQDALGELADEVLWISALPHVKLCVSCRPWNVFVRKFSSAVTLRLDLLTHGDMTKYVEARLLSTVIQCDFQHESRLGDKPAEKLVRNVANAVANAAEGVFLWTELVTKTLCSELRKGSNIEQLHKIICEFPADLDDYFYTLIFDRIGKTRRNVQDTAAALTLALEINRYAKEDGIRVAFPSSYMNFWLLGQGLLRNGFSWTHHDEIDQSPIDQMVKQTRSFLEETCKDLLVLFKTSLGDWEVDFLHRTVYDFLRDSHINIQLVQNAPGHFLDADFITELARLRCLCLLGQRYTNCRGVSDVLGTILFVSKDAIPGTVPLQWLAACQTMTITQMQTYCNCGGLDHLAETDVSFRCLEAGLGGYLLEAVKHLPYQALTAGPALCPDLLGVLLLGPKYPEVSSTYVPSLDALRQVLECGCNPNHSILTSEQSDLQCNRTCWGAWLKEMYLQSRQSDKSFEELHAQKRTIGAIISLLLEYGADPHCMTCIACHERLLSGALTATPTFCRLLALNDLLPLILLPEVLANITGLKAACADKVTILKLRRNRYRRAVRSFAISERNLTCRVADGCYSSAQRILLDQRLEQEQRKYIMALMLMSIDYEHYDAECMFCSKRRTKKVLITWCIDCCGSSYLCRRCCAVSPHRDYGLRPLCRASGDAEAADVDGHTSIVIDVDTVLDGHIPQYEEQVLHYAPAQAIVVLKDWYARNPI